MPKITYVHTTQRETISIHEALQKAVRSDKMKGQDTDGGEHVQIFRFGIVRISSSQVIYLHATGPKVQEVQHVANTEVRREFKVIHRVYILV